MPEDQYPGVITRQSLVDYCQAQLPRLQEHAEALEKAMAVADDRGDTGTAMYFGESLASLRGEQISLRNVCEWAKTVAVKGVFIPADKCEEITGRLQGTFPVVASSVDLRDL
jgi:hypothetical protein